MSVMKILADQIGVLVVQNAEQANLIMRLQHELERFKSLPNGQSQIAGYEGNDQEGVSYVSRPLDAASGK